MVEGLRRKIHVSTRAMDQRRHSCMCAFVTKPKMMSPNVLYTIFLYPCDYATTTIRRVSLLHDCC